MSQLGFMMGLVQTRKFVNGILLGFVFLCLCGLTSSQNGDSGGGSGGGIEEKIKDFLSSHCNKQNQTLEQEEYEIFVRCNPTQAAMIVRNIDSHQESDLDTRHKEIQKEINSQCNAWPTKRSCQRKNFKLIEKCFDDTICQDGDHFIEFWEKGGNKCLNQHLMKLTEEISQCLTVTSTMTKDELDKNIDKITGCIGDKFSNCGNKESNKVIQNLLQDIETFYKEIKAAASTSSASRFGGDGGAITCKFIISSFVVLLSMQVQNFNVLWR